MAWVAAGLMVGTLAGGLWMSFPRGPEEVAETRTEISTGPTTEPFSFALSPDGRRLVFVATNEGQECLWLRPLAETDAHVLPGTEGARHPFWAPDSRSIAFFANGKLKRLDIGSG